MRTAIQLRIVVLALLYSMIQITDDVQERNLGRIDGGVTIVVDQPVDKLVVESINGKSTLIVKVRLVTLNADWLMADRMLSSRMQAM